MHDTATGYVQHSPRTAAQPTGGVPHHACHHRVHHAREKKAEDGVCLEAHALGDRTGHDRHSRACEIELEKYEGVIGLGAQTRISLLQGLKFPIAEDGGAAFRERKTVADAYPHQRTDCGIHEILGHDILGVFAVYGAGLWTSGTGGNPRWEERMR